MRHILALPLLLLTLSATAEELPTKPFIRLEMEQHNGPIHRIAVDAAGQRLVTGSSDKTARLWDIPTGDLVRVFRIPMGSGPTSRVLAVAMTPNGKLVAIGGIMDEHSVYVFDVDTGRFVRRLKGATNDITELAISPDGTRVVAGQIDGGLRAWRLKDGAKAGQDTQYKGAINGLSFDKSGRLVTSASDGKLRIYDAKLALTKKVDAPSGTQPAGVQFSPDGSKIAVGYNDVPMVDVLSSTDLKVAFKPDVTNVKTSRLLKAVWSPDGQRLTAAGTSNVIRSWDRGGQGAPVDWKKNTLEPVADIESLPDGVVFAAGDPAWGVQKFDGSRPVFKGPVHADFRAIGNNLRVSREGEKVQFTLDPKGKQVALFNVGTRTLTFSPPDDPELGTARQTADSADFGAWRNAPDIKLNGRSLGFKDELVRTLSISIDGTFFVVGGDQTLRGFTMAGKPLWFRTVPAVPLATNIAVDGHTVVTAYADGTIRWQRTADGEELMALFIHPSSKEWVLYTPVGYYDSSENGHAFLGWVKNHGKDAAADMQPSGMHRARYRRPDIISLVLPTADLQLAIEEADSKRYAESLKEAKQKK